MSMIMQCMNGWQIFLLMILVGCSVAPQYVPPEVDIPSEWHSAPSEGMSPDDPDGFLWWESFHDPILNSLIQRASQQNLDLFIAGTRLSQARALKKGKAAEAYPHIDASLTTGHLYYSKDALVKGILDAACPHHHHSINRNVNFFEMGFDANWEIDLFGVNKHAVSALEAKIESSKENLCDIWVTISAEIARHYIELRSWQERLGLIQQQIQSQQETIYLTQELFTIGVISEIELLQMKEQLETLQSQKAPMELGIDQAIHRLSILLGYPPSELFSELCESRELPQLPCDKPIGLPSELVRRRPDIRKAERDLASATELVASAIAALFPRFSLMGFIGNISTQLHSLTNSASATWFLAPQLLIPVFNSQLLTQDVDLNKIQARQALFEYQKTVIQALEEVENALTSFSHEQEKYRHLGEAQHILQQSYDLNLQLYQSGIKDYLEVLAINRSLLAAEETAIRSQTQLLLNYIALYKALGGGWDVTQGS